MELSQRALSAVQRFPLKGQGILEREWVGRLMNEMEKTKKAGTSD